MKLYTWIVIGMIVGVIAGWLLGPDSPILSGQAIMIDRGRVPTLYSQPSTESETLPQRNSLRSKVIRTSEGWTELRIDGNEDTPVFVPSENLPPERYSDFALSILSIFSVLGGIFLRLLKMLVVPLVFFSLASGVASLGDPKKLGRMGGITLGYFFCTTAIAVSIGLGLSLFVRPGDTISEDARDRLVGGEGFSVSMDQLPGWQDRLLQLVPENPVEALADGNMLQIIFFAAMLGAALCLMKRDVAGPILKLFESGTEVMVRMVTMVMTTAPIGVAALMAIVMATSGFSVMMALLLYGFVVLLGLFLHVGLCYVPIVRLVAGVKIRKFFKAARPTQLVTFGTSSSSAALPVTLECAQDGLGISKKISSFVVPVGSTVNMDGTALYQGVATVFIAQIYGLDLGVADLLQVVLMATLASVGAAGVPGAGMVTLAMVLTSLGLPLEGIAIIMGLDRILDMFRSAVNVTGDLSCTAVVARLHGERPGT